MDMPLPSAVGCTVAGVDCSFGAAVARLLLGWGCLCAAVVAVGASLRRAMYEKPHAQ